MRLHEVPAILAISLLATGCGSQVGDSCSSNVDCSPAGDRICDTAQIDGYCTLEGCELNSCPDSAVCIRFFAAGFLTRTCDPATDNIADPKVTPSYSCGPGEVCLSSGFCTQRTSERRFCMKPCESDGDCRDGYLCTRTGIGGAEAIPDPSQPSQPPIRFCAQRPDQGL